MSDFHFIRPLWLLAFAALAALMYLLKKHKVQQSGWQKLLPKHLANVLVDNRSSSQSMSIMGPFIIGILTIIALAGPTWKKLPQPVYQLQQGSVLIMDMSYSMLATDLAPNRLTRARYKANDLLDSLNQGEMGLIAYAGDAFVISPLTEDINNLKLLLPSLTPDIMPAVGSNPIAALELAHKMLKNAGHIKGDIYWFTDGIDNQDTQDITQWSREHPYKLNILGIGTPDGAPIKLTNGELMKNNRGAIILPKLSQELLAGVASRGNGVYQNITTQSADIEALVKVAKNRVLGEAQEDEDSLSSGDHWQEFGPWLILCILPILLYYFRRGALLSLLPLLFLVPTEPVYATTWQDLWQTPNQQAQSKYISEDYVQAAETFEDTNWQGSALYRAGEYEKAITAFQQSNTAEAYYNQGNSYAGLKKLDEAIAAYDKALELNPDFEAAKTNKEILEKQKELELKSKNSSGEQDKENQHDQEETEQGQDNKDETGEQQENSSGQEQPQDQQEQQGSEQSQQNSDAQSELQEQDPKDEEQQLNKKQESDISDPEDGDSKSIPSQSTLAKEAEQKQQKLFNKVTDDPYLLLRNKMQLEYQKRRHEQSNSGVEKKW